MAFFDDNNSGIPAGAGKDPLDELERELNELKLSLGELDPQDEPAQEQPEPIRQTPAENTTVKPSAAGSYASGASAGPAPTAPGTHTAKPADTAPDRHDSHADRYAPQGKPKGSGGSKGPHTAIIIAALIVAFIGVAVGITVYLLNNTGAEPEPVTVHDSELGTVQLQPVEGASVNEYASESLVKDDNGYYAYYVDGVKTSELGVDLSEYQGEIDFAAVKAAGVDFVMLRIGGRYYGDEGKLYSDSAFKDYYRQAKDAGLKVGAYFFSQAASREDAVEEANYALELLGGLTLEYPIAIDWETIDDDDARTDDVTGEELTAIAAAFCDTVEAAGYSSAVYASTSLILQSYDFSVMKNYDFWLADYRELPEKDSMYYSFTIWQYSDSGTVPGIEGEVDLNLCLNAGK